MGALRTHNAYTTHEVELLRKHWPTMMPMEDLLALLPRHTEHSITGYANKKLGLTRPTSRSAVGSPRAQPAWNRLRELLEKKPMTQLEISTAMGFSRSRASELLRDHPGEVYIVDWRWPKDGIGRAESLWTLGDCPDAPEPMGEQRMRKTSRRRANPFAVAAGLVQVSEGKTGRVFKQSMEIEEWHQSREAA